MRAANGSRARAAAPAMRPVSLVVLGALLAAGALRCNGSQSGPDACISAGGQCVLGGAVTICAKQGPLGCNTDPPNPGGAFCCLEFLDASDATVDATNGDASDGGCGAPDAATYSCAPEPPDAGGCPPWGNDGSSSASYPLGCVSTLPECSAFSNYSSAQTCNCQVLFDAGPRWICPL